MNHGKSVQKSRTPKREPRPEKIRKNSKDENEMEKNISKLAASSKDKIKGEKHRSESLSRPRHPFKSQETPRKSHSMDRNQSTYQKTTIKTDMKGGTGKSDTKTINDIGKKTNVSSNSTKHKNYPTKVSTDKSNSSTSQKSKINSRAPKVIERKNSVQVAKSFVKNVQSKASRSSDRHKSDLKKQVDVIEKNLDQEYNLDRPRTSTIRKGPSDIVSNIVSESDYITKETKSLKNSSLLSRSRASLNGDSDNDKASYEEDFEDYDSDFEESDAVSISESSSSESTMDDEEENCPMSQKGESNLVHDSTTLSNLSVETTAINVQPKNAAEKTFLKMSDRSSLYSKKNASEQLMDKKPMMLSRSIINFTTAVEKNEERNVEELKNSPQLLDETNNDYSSRELQDIATYNTNYALYKSNLKQAFVQTENSEEEEVQTDVIEMCNKWTQNPTNGTSGYGGDEITTIGDKTAAWKSLFNVQSTKLTSFLQKSSNIILTLLDEEFSTFSNEYHVQRRPNFFYSDSYYVLSPLNFLLGVPIISVCCSEGSPYIATIHGNMTELPSENGNLVEKGVICVWNISEYKKPEYILTANCQPTCGTFGPGGSDIVVAGMVDGAVMLWDLSDLNTNTLQVELDGSLTLRSPTYNTALILGSENHGSCVVGIQTVSNREKDWRSSVSARTGSMKNFHVMTLEDMGVLIIWVVVEVLKPDISGLETDLGLAPGGKFRLVRSSCILLHNLPTLQVLQKTSIRTFDFRPVPFDPSRMLVSTDAGIVLHVTRHSGGVEPRFYGNETEFSAEIRCLDCSPHNEDIFLVGCSDGSIQLYNVKLVRPLSEFLQPSKGEPITLLKWSSVHPSVFCVLSSSSHIHLWNLVEDSVHPLQSYNFEDCKITWFVFKILDQYSSHQTRNNPSYFIISKENGEVEVHTFQQEINEDDYKKQLGYMKNL